MSRASTRSNLADLVNLEYVTLQWSLLNKAQGWIRVPDESTLSKTFINSMEKGVYEQLEAGGPINYSYNGNLASYAQCFMLYAVLCYCPPMLFLGLPLQLGYFFLK